VQRGDWDKVTRITHWALMITFTFQLFGGLLVSTPGTYVYFYAHEYGGLLALAVIVAFWLWTHTNYDVPRLFPWSRAGMQEVMTELRGLRRERLPAPGRARGLSSFVHGLGLLAATGMALTGLMIFLTVPGGRGAWDDTTSYSAFTNFVLLHKLIAYPLWIYYFGHIGFTALHLFRQTTGIGAIFRIRDGT
jgi:cytochrome b